VIQSEAYIRTIRERVLAKSGYMVSPFMLESKVDSPIVYRVCRIGDATAPVWMGALRIKNKEKLIDLLVLRKGKFYQAQSLMSSLQGDDVIGLVADHLALKRWAALLAEHGTNVGEPTGLLAHI
jgi:hypothetical protein